MRHQTNTDPWVLETYRQALDRVYADSATLIEDAPSWQAGLYASVRACYTEMRANPAALRLHFFGTNHSPAVQRARTHHRNRMLQRLVDTRDDAPPTLHAELLLSMIHGSLRRQIEAGGVPPELDEAEQTFAELLFHYEEAA